MKRSTFYKCEKCGTIALKTVDGGGEMCCCKQPMVVVDPNTTDAAKEKHVPEVHLDGDTLKVQIGSTPHPMTPDHLIEWVYVVTEEGVIAQCLTEDDAPAVEINLAGQVPTAVFSYCNLHGLWKTDL